jgi:Omp85 superfamily domain
MPDPLVLTRSSPRLAVALLAFMLTGAPRADAQSSDSAAHKSAGVTPIVAPIPFHNPQFDWGLDLLGALIHRIGGDTAGPPSTAVVTGFATLNESWGVAAAEIAHLSGDAWRLQVLGGYFDLKYQFYGVGQTGGSTPIGLRQPVAGARVAGFRRVAPNAYLGLGVQGAYVRVGLQDSVVPPAFADFLTQRATVNQLALAPMLQIDSRDDEYFPARGLLMNLEAHLYMAAIGSDSTFQNYSIAAAWYSGWRRGRSVVAVGALSCYSTGEVPFYLLCTIGGFRGLRGVEMFRYLDNTMTTLQAEYRHMLGNLGILGRLGFAVFGGVAGVASTPGTLSTSQFIPAGGAGVRFRLTKRYPLNFRVDVAGSKDGTLYYVSVAENF